MASSWAWAGSACSRSKADVIRTPAPKRTRTHVFEQIKTADEKALADVDAELSASRSAGARRVKEERRAKAAFAALGKDATPQHGKAAAEKAVSPDRFLSI